MANTPPRRQDASAAPATSPSLPAQCKCGFGPSPSRCFRAATQPPWHWLNRVVKCREEHEMNDEVEIVVKMPGSGDYLPATLLRSDTSRDIALLRVTNNDDKSKIGRSPSPLMTEFPHPWGRLWCYWVTSLQMVSSDAFGSVAEDETFMDIDKGLDELIKANCPSIEGCSGSPATNSGAQGCGFAY
ncbi:unnamed protein product [Miscanthus lutarioriparius]|uniref:Uncharacterized protein n=1 Tax=Miscanthus lutarioriparius TaxID=422564 RepID=A0A811P533_9POAL|nr:unnamed protein product [Miscanthus lutarioriparius]